MLSQAFAFQLSIALFCIIVVWGFMMAFSSDEEYRSKRAAIARLSQWITIIVLSIVEVWALVSAFSGQHDIDKQKVSSYAASHYNMTLTEDEADRLANIVSYDTDSDSIFPSGEVMLDGKKFIVIVDKSGDFKLLQNKGNALIEYKP